jgi:hypothetical protein
MVVPSKNNKPRVEEIDGAMWQVDEKGKPIKKLRKKTKQGDGPPESPSRRSSSRVKEIDGQIFQLDEAGNPIKKLRKKGDKSGLSVSMHGPSAAKADNVDSSAMGGKRLSLRKIKYEPLAKPQASGGSARPSRCSGSPSQIHHHNNRSKSPCRNRDGRSKSPGRRGEETSTREPRPKRRNSMGNHGPRGTTGRSQSPGGGDRLLDKSPPHSPSSPSSADGKREYVDDKGRRVIVDADGNKIAFDKNGKKLRPKNKHGDLAKSRSGDSQLSEMQRQLQAAQEEVQRLKRQTQLDQAKIAKATEEMETLKYKHNKATEEKRMLDLQLKNFQQRLEEQEKQLAEMPKLNSDGSNAVPTHSGDHLVKQITGLMDENNILLQKLAKEKSAAAEELKRKEEELRYLKMELQKLRAENDLLFRTQGKGSGNEENPLVEKLLSQKEEVEAKLTERIQQLQDRVETLQKRNETLNEDLNKATLEIHEDDDEETRKAKQMAQAVVQHGTQNVTQAKKANVFLNNGLSSEVALSSASNAMRMIYRANKNTPQEKKTWF